MEKEVKGGDDIQINDFIYLICFELLKRLLKIFFSPLLLNIYYFMMQMWPWISLERDSCCRWNPGTSSTQCHNNPVLVPPSKPPNTVKDLYDGQTYDPKTRVDIWTRMDVVTVEYGAFAHKFHLTMWFFQFINGITFKCDHVIWSSIALLIRIGLWTKLIIYRVPPNPIKWYCRGFGFLWQEFMLDFMLWNKNDFKVSHRNQVNAPYNMNLVTSQMYFECQPCGIFEGL